VWQLVTHGNLDIFDVLLLALGILIAAVYLINGLSRPVYLGNTDPVTYNELGIKFMQTGRISDDYWPAAYYMIVGAVYKVLGPNYLWAKLLNILLLLASCLILYRILDALFALQRKKLYFAIFLLFLLFDAEYLFYFSTLYKEAFNIFLTLASLYLFLRAPECSRGGQVAAGILAAILGLFAAEINAWFAGPLILWGLLIIVDLKGIDASVAKLKRTLPFLLSFALAFSLFAFCFALLYRASTGNFHVFPNNGLNLLFDVIAPTGCESVLYSVDNRACQPNYGFLERFAAERGKNFSALDQYEQSLIKQEYIVPYALSHPGKLLARVGPFLKLWIFPNVQQSQRVILSSGDYLLRLWLTFLLGLIGLGIGLYRKTLRNGWIYVAAFYLVCTFSYLMTVYLMRYKLSFRVFELLFAAYAIYAALELVVPQGFGEGLRVRLAYALPVIALTLIIVGVAAAPYWLVRTETSYNLLWSELRRRPEATHGFLVNGFDRNVPSDFGVTLTDNCIGLELSQTARNSLHTGVVEMYPGGAIWRGAQDVKEWLVLHAQTPQVDVVTDLKTLRSDGTAEVDAIINSQRVRIPVTVRRGLVLSPDFTNYYLNPCR
jgi:hypothetical protein